MHLIRRHTRRVALSRYSTTTYTFNLPLLGIVPKRAGDTLSQTLPPREEEREKVSSLREDIAQLRKGMRLWSEGSTQWRKCEEEIVRLEQLLC